MAVDVPPTLQILKFAGGGNPGVFPFPGTQVLGGQIGADLENAVSSVKNIDTSVYMNRWIEFLGDEYALHGDEADALGGVFKRSFGGFDNWARVHLLLGLDNRMEIASGLHVVHPFGVPTLAFLYWEYNAAGGGDMRYASTTDGVSWSDVEISLFADDSSPDGTGMSLVWRKAIVWVTSRINAAPNNGRAAHIWDTELETISHLNGFLDGVSPINTAAERSVHVHKNKLFAMGEGGATFYEIQRLDGGAFTEIHEETGGGTGNLRGTNGHGHGVMFTDPATGNLIAIMAGGPDTAPPADVGGTKVLSLPDADTDSKPATANDVSASVMGAVSGADKYLAGGGSADVERRWWVIVDTQTAPGTDRVFLLTGDGPSGGDTEMWQWKGIGAEMEPIAGLVGISNILHAFPQVLNGGGGRYPRTGAVEMEGIPLEILGGTRVQFRGVKSAGPGVVTFRGDEREGAPVDVIPIVAASLSFDAGLLEDILGYWKFNEASGSRSDSSGNAFTLNEVGTVGSAGGLFGNAASFPGTNGNYLTRPGDDGLLDIGQALAPFTVSGWINVSAIPAVQGRIVNKSDEFSNGWIFLVDSDGSVAFVAFPGFVMASDALDITVAAGWQHVLATSDGVTGRLYVDGVQKDTTPADAIINSTAPLLVGQRNNNDLPFAGLMDELSVSDRYSTPGMVQQIYSAGAGRELVSTPPTIPSISGDTLINFTSDGEMTRYTLTLDTVAVGIATGAPGTIVPDLV